ncbi:MAG: hypothetical protein OXB92_02195 [Acidimicrobiaceae bacterium]|nr:hypothetical protein [Acidimicrobiaceae bacterium]
MIRLRVLAVVALLLAASACRVDTTVDIRVDDDGSGEVTVEVVVDSEAVALIPDAPDGLQLSDLGDAGWTVNANTVDRAGALTVNVSKRFGSADALGGVLAEIAGEDVIFEGFTLVKQYNFDVFGLDPARTDYALSGTVDPTFDVEQLGGVFPGGLAPLGRSAESIEDDFEGGFEDALGLTVTVRMPETLQMPEMLGGANGEVVDETVIWTMSYGDPAVNVEANSSAESILVRVWTMVALSAAALLVLLLVSYLVGFLLAKWRTPKGRRRRDVRRRQHRAATRAQEATRPRRRMLRLLVLDVHGVLVRPTNPLEGALLPLVMAEQPDVDPERVRELHRLLVLGRVSPSEFWSELDLSPVAQRMETRYLSSFRLNQGLHPFLKRMNNSGLPVAVIGNQPRAWGDRLRAMAALEDSVASWMVSGDVGSILPEPALFEATRRTMSVDLFDCFYLSSIPGNLDVAEELGMATGLFLTGNDAIPDTDHTVVLGFEDLLKTRGT